MYMRDMPSAYLAHGADPECTVHSLTYEYNSIVRYNVLIHYILILPLSSLSTSVRPRDRLNGYSLAPYI